MFAIPLLLDPYRWARAFGWPAETETDVGLYFGRCLGALATTACVQAARAARDPEGHRSYFEFVQIAGWLLAAVHLRDCWSADSRQSSTSRSPDTRRWPSPRVDTGRDRKR